MIKKIETSFKLLQIESLLTVMVFSVPVLTIFLHDIGLNQTAVGISQAVFMAVAMLFDVPSGWLADRFSRKMSNFFGDLLVAAGFFFYATVSSLTGVIIAEILVGAGMAFTNGADVALLKSYATKLKKDYQKISAKLGSLRPLAEVVAFGLGGLIATYNIRATFVVSGIMFVIGAIISLLIQEVGVRRITEKHPLRDMYEITKYSLHGHPALKWRIIAGAVSANITHTVIWIFTPMLIYVGVNKSFVGLAWAATLLFVSLGSLVARRFAPGLSDSQKIIIPMIAAVAAYLIIGISITTITIFFVLIFSLVRGWFMAVTSPMIQHVAPADIQATVISVSSLLRRLLYIPLVIIVNYLGNTSLQSALIGSAVIYGVLLVPVAIGMKRNRAT